MKKLLFSFLLALALAGSLFAQGQCPGGSCTGFYEMLTSWYPFGGQATFWNQTQPGISQGFTNQLVQLHAYSDWLDTAAYCWTYPSPNAYIEFGFAMAGCPKGVYASLDGSNGYWPDNPPPSQTAWYKMIHDGVTIDATDGFTQIEVFEEYWSCENYYNGPSVNYDIVYNPCAP